jgi:hypothetical protein
MTTWGWRGNANEDAVLNALRATLEARGLVATDDVDVGPLGAFVRVAPDGAGGTVVLGTALGGLAIGRALCELLAVGASFVDVDFDPRGLSASAYVIDARGGVAPGADIERDARELYDDALERWAARPRLVEYAIALLLDAGDAASADGVELAFRREPSTRASSIARAVRSGASLERTPMGGRTAVRVIQGGAMRITFLDEAEALELDRELSPQRKVTPSSESKNA